MEDLDLEMDRGKVFNNNVTQTSIGFFYGISTGVYY